MSGDAWDVAHPQLCTRLCFQVPLFSTPHDCVEHGVRTRPQIRPGQNSGIKSHGVAATVSILFPASDHHWPIYGLSALVSRLCSETKRRCRQSRADNRQSTAIVNPEPCYDLLSLSLKLISVVLYTVL
jgi:hypothetical protein